MEKLEYIICAAIHFDDLKVHQQQPRNISTGIVLCGRRHHNVFSVMDSLGHNYKSEFQQQPIQGFVTSRDRFLNRTDSAIIAFKAGQIENESDYLISEDIY